MFQGKGDELAYSHTNSRGPKELGHEGNVVTVMKVQHEGQDTVDQEQTHNFKKWIFRYGLLSFYCCCYLSYRLVTVSTARFTWFQIPILLWS